jgi:hypothetical protein
MNGSPASHVAASIRTGPFANAGLSKTQIVGLPGNNIRSDLTRSDDLRYDQAPVISLDFAGEQAHALKHKP